MLLSSPVPECIRSSKVLLAMQYSCSKLEIHCNIVHADAGLTKCAVSQLTVAHGTTPEDPPMEPELNKTTDCPDGTHRLSVSRNSLWACM